MASNSVLGNLRSLDELIQLQLLESFCLLILQYATCAVKLSSSQSAELNSCWNNVNRRIFNFRKYDSIHSCICGLGRLDFHHLRTSLNLIFINKGFYASNNVVRCTAKLFSVSDEFWHLCTNDQRGHVSSQHWCYSHSCATLFCIQELHDDLIVNFHFYGHLSALCLLIFFLLFS